MSQGVFRIILFLEIFFLFASDGLALTEYRYVFREKTGSQSSTIVWNVAEEKAGFRQNVSDKSGISNYRMDRSYETLEWKLSNSKSQTDFTALLNNRTINIRGLFGRKEIAQTIKIGEKPWYQNFPFSLAPFILSGNESIDFMSLRPNDLKPFEMTARKSGVLNMVIDGESVQVQKVRVSLPGLLFKFWHGDYLFRCLDGQFIRYEGVNGPPGTPRTEIELLSSLPVRGN